MRRQQRLCIVSRGRAKLFGYLTTALMPADGLELRIDRRGTRCDMRSGDRNGKQHWSGDDRRHVCVDAELSSRGWALLARDDGSDTWVPGPVAPMQAGRERARSARAHRERQAFIFYIGVAVVVLAVVALAGLVVVGGLRLPGSSSWMRPAGTAPQQHSVIGGPAVSLPALLG